MQRAGIPTARFVDRGNRGRGDESAGPLRLSGRPQGRRAGRRQGRHHCAHARRGGTAVADSSRANSSAAPARLVIEEFLNGEEVSFIVLADGKDIVPLEPTQDHKAVHDGDTGPNTGGMGAYCDSPHSDCGRTPEVPGPRDQSGPRQMRADGTPFTGFLYAGLMMTPTGRQGARVQRAPRRSGNAAVDASLDSDFAEVLAAAARGNLPDRHRSSWNDRTLGLRRTGGARISRRAANRRSDHRNRAGRSARSHRVPRRDTAGEPRARNIRRPRARRDRIGPDARRRDRATPTPASSQIHFDGMHYRSDIGAKGLKRWPSAVE